MGKPKAPPAPDYAAAAKEQGVANKDASVSSAKLNNPNIINPYGTQTVTYGGADGLTPTITQTLSPEQQALLDKSNQTQGLLGDLGIQGATALQGVIGKQLDLSGAPAQPGSYDQTRQNVINAMMGRADEDYGQQTDQANSDLIAAGIRPGTQAYDNRMQRIERSRNDARNQAEISGGNAASQAFAMDSQRRQQGISELLAQRQTPLNEINALMSGSQVNNPFSMPGASQNSNIAPAPVFGATQAQGAWDQNAFAQKMGSYNNMMSGLFSLGGSAAMGAGMMKSDIRLKSNIVKIGDHPLGIGIYEYDMDGKRDVGVMAQDVLKVKPEAVLVHPSGYYMVNYGAL
jgi:hypothetical protein